MRSRRCAVAIVFSFVLPLALSARQARDVQSVTLEEKTQIPGAQLKPGAYTFSVEDRLADRAIVRISAEGGPDSLLLAVPNPRLAGAGARGLTFFDLSHGKKNVLRGWMCPECSTELEFVYSKAEAAKLTEETPEPVMAFDPEYDKLPANLSPDDMKVVTLWLLTPKPLTATDRQKGVEARKYVPPVQMASATAHRQESVHAGTPVSPTQPVQIASAETTRPVQHRLPKTAGSNFSLMFWGIVLMLAAAALRFSRVRRTR